MIYYTKVNGLFSLWILSPNVNSIGSQNKQFTEVPRRALVVQFHDPSSHTLPKSGLFRKIIFQGKVYHFPTLSEEKFYLFKKRTNLLSHSWRLTVKIVCDKELDPLHFFCGNNFCASITFTKQA